MEIDYGKYLTVLAIGMVALIIGIWVETARYRPVKVKKRRENNPPLGDYKSIKEWE